MLTHFGKRHILQPIVPSLQKFTEILSTWWTVWNSSGTKCHWGCNTTFNFQLRKWSEVLGILYPNTSIPHDVLMSVQLWSILISGRSVGGLTGRRSPPRWSWSGCTLAETAPGHPGSSPASAKPSLMWRSPGTGQDTIFNAQYSGQD